MSISAIAHTGAGSNADFDSPNVDTTGATFLVAFLTYFGGQVITFTDSKGNTWTPLTNFAENTGGNRANSRYYYVNGTPIVGASHHVHVADNTANGGFGAVCFAAFSGVTTVSPFDVQSGFGQTTGATTIQPGSITPSGNGRLILCGRGIDDPSGDTHTVNSGLTILDTIDVVTGTHFGSSLAWIEQSVAAAINPTFTRTNAPTSGGDVAVIAAFAPAAAGNPPPPHDLMHQRGWMPLLMQ